jgi:hypothetical protein
VVLQVTTPQAPRTPLATINYGWESPEFYTRWTHGDTEAGNEITQASLDPINRQSRYAHHLLKLFQEQFMTDAAYIARLARHYELFKETQRQPAETSPPASLSAPAGLPQAPVTVDGILQQLRHVPDQADFAPYEAALRAAREQREAIVPELIAAVDRVADNPAPYLEPTTDFLHHFAIYLLAEFRESRALDSFLRFFSLPGEQSLDLTGDLVTERGAAVLASVCGGDPAPLLRLVHDPAVNVFVRIQALEGLAVQGLWGERPREAVVEELRRLFHSLARPGDGYVWARLVQTICDYQVPELAAEARQAFADKLVDEEIFRRSDLEKGLGNADRWAQESFRERNDPIIAANECAMWVCFRDEREDVDPWEDEAEDAAAESLSEEEPTWAGAALDVPSQEPPPKPVPYVAPPKVGRNDPCPCGSGRKFKKCCGK